MNKYRILVLTTLLLIISSVLVERIYLRDATALQRVVAITVQDAGAKELPLETLEIVNDDSIELFAKDALIQLLNFRPGRVVEHVEQDVIKKLFINKESYNKVREQLITWSNYEFKVNNISIKEAVAEHGVLMSTSANQVSGMKLWKYRATVLTLDRGVGKTIPTKVFIDLRMVYLGPQGGMGIYSIKMTL